MSFPSFDICLPDLNRFIMDLMHDHHANKLSSWDELDQKVKTFFTPERMAQMESLVPGWMRMASFSGGVTLTHVSCVFLGLFRLREFECLTPAQQQLAKWIVLFHDVEKEHIKGKRDFTHGFRGAAVAAKSLAALGFSVTNEYANLIEHWSQFTSSAITKSRDSSEAIQDNSKLSDILSGVENMFGHNTEAAQITKVVLLHMSVDVVDDYPQASPLTTEEINLHLDNDIIPLLKVMMLADNEGWVLFDPETRAKQRSETIAAFEIIEKNFSKIQ